MEEGVAALKEETRRVLLKAIVTLRQADFVGVSRRHHLTNE